MKRPFYFTDPTMLGGFIFLELLLAILVKFREAFFPVLITVFLLAGMWVPGHSLWVSARWVVLGTGAIVGFLYWLQRSYCPVRLPHLVALGCVLTAIVSALVSVYPDVALLKALSLLLLFVYSITGARAAVIGREEKFFSSLVWGCEALVYVSAVAYFGLHLELFGNRNSLGVAMGVVALPFLLWGLLVSNSRSLRRRRMLAVLLCQLLLLSSYERAGIVAALTSSTLLCITLRRYRFMFTGLAVVLVTAFLVATFVPLPEVNQPDDDSVTSRFVYKGKREEGVLASRKTVWEKTILSLQQHPYLGAGFGTTATAYDKTQVNIRFASGGQVSREHGNSYLEIAEWVGVVGVVPFGALLLLLAGKAISICMWIRRTGMATSPAVPLAIFIAGALVHAGFEDWLFAVGYHTCVLFWVFALMLPDFSSTEPATRIAPFMGMTRFANYAQSRSLVASNPSCTFS
ncbi:MAG: O-antigen ligase family protein [Acidobacteriaceae bacterium]|nr:O-antigen ligase family protein [Acidobacteriaceae bacterium]